MQAKEREISTIQYSVLTVQDSRHLIEVKVAPNKGLGVFAKVDIPRGTRVLAEAAVLKINTYPYAQQIIRVFETLGPSAQDSYLNLFGYTNPEGQREFADNMDCNWQEIDAFQRTVLSIYTANAFMQCVFLLGSRFNHSCVPNTQALYNAALDMQTMHTIRDVAAGEELTIMYTTTCNLNRRQRGGQLEKWGFLCSCSACGDTEEAQKGDEKRTLMYGLDQALAFNTKMGYWPMVRKQAKKLAAMQEAEGFVGRDLGLSCRDITRAYVKLGDAKSSLTWAEKELKVAFYCTGADHPDYISSLEETAALRNAAENNTPIPEFVVQSYYQTNVDDGEGNEDRGDNDDEKNDDEHAKEYYIVI